jgi:hypothetical protein
LDTGSGNDGPPPALVGDQAAFAVAGDNRGTIADIDITRSPTRVKTDTRS